MVLDSHVYRTDSFLPVVNQIPYPVSHIRYSRCMRDTTRTAVFDNLLSHAKIISDTLIYDDVNVIYIDDHASNQN
jgi:hypothetical protein